MNRFLIFFIGLFVVLTSCKDETYTDVFAEDKLSLSKDKMSFKSAAGGLTISVAMSETWRIDTTGTPSWCKVTSIYDYKEGDYVSVYVTENGGIDPRTTTFKIVSDFDSRDITVTQLGSGIRILTNVKDTLYFNIDQTFVDIELTTNTEFTMESNSPSWLKIIKGYENDETPVRISLTDNDSDGEREGKIVLSAKESDYEKTIVFIQKKEIVDYEQGDISNLVGNHKLTIVSANASTTAEGCPIEKSYDNNNITYFQSDWQPIDVPVVLEYIFGEENSLHYFTYSPNARDDKKSFSNVDIYVKTVGGEYELKMVHQFVGNATQIVTFKDPILKPQGIKFVVKSVNNVSERTVIAAACSEMKFFSTDLQYETIFTDKSYSKLKDGVTLEEIFNIQDVFFRDIAQYLYHGRYPMIRARKYESYPTATAMHKMKAFGMLDNATGISVKQGEEVVIMVDNVGTKKVSLSILENASDFKLKTVAQLSDGVSKLTMEAEGQLYLNYYDTSSDIVSVHIAGGSVNGYYDTIIHTEEMGRAYLNKAQGKYFDLFGKYVHLILPTEALKINCTSLKALVEKYDRIVALEQEFNGITKYNKTQKNRICIKGANTTPITANVILIPDQEMEFYANENHITGDILFDIASRVANVHLVTGIGTWAPSAKDLYAIYVQEKMDGTHKLVEENIYKQAYLKFFPTTENFVNKAITSDLTRVVPFWQIHLYMTKVLGVEDFYADLHSKLTKTTEVSFLDECNKLANIYFGEFFYDWHFFAKGAVRPTVAPLGLKYISESNIELYKNINPVVPGKYKANQKVIQQPDGSYLVTYEIVISNASNVVAYEVVNYGMMVDVAFSNSFFSDLYTTTATKIFAVGADGLRKEILK